MQGTYNDVCLSKKDDDAWQEEASRKVVGSNPGFSSKIAIVVDLEDELVVEFVDCVVSVSSIMH